MDGIGHVAKGGRGTAVHGGHVVCLSMNHRHSIQVGRMNDRYLDSIPCSHLGCPKAGKGRFYAVPGHGPMLLRTLPTSLLATACGCEDSEESTGSDSHMPLQQIRHVRTFPYTLDLESTDSDDAGLPQEPRTSIEIRDRKSAVLPRRAVGAYLSR
jgi:hypothetical protein